MKSLRDSLTAARRNVESNGAGEIANQTVT